MAASVAAELHGVWAADTTLNGLLPASRVFTGRAPRGTTLPYATLSQPTGTDAGQGTQNRWRSEQWRVQVWVAGEAYAAGEAIQRAVEDAFSNHDNDLTSGGILRIGLAGGFAIQEEEATTTIWQFVVDLDVTVERPRAQ